MKPIAALQAAALVLWGFTLEQPFLGIGLAVTLLMALAGRLHVRLNERNLEHAFDWSLLTSAFVLIAFLAVRGLPGGLLAAVAWLPAIWFAVLLLGGMNETPLRLRHLLMTLRQSPHPDAQKLVPIDTLFLGLTLVAAAVTAKPSQWFYWVAAILIGVWICPLQRKPRAPDWIGFALAGAIAIGSGYAISVGLRWGQSAMQDWFIDVISNVDKDPYKSQTRIGDLGRIKLSDRIAWRVEMGGNSQPPLLLRSGVFTRYLNGEWLAQATAFTPMTAGIGQGQPDLVLHGGSHQGTALAPLPSDAGTVSAGSATMQRNRYGVVRLNHAATMLTLKVWRSTMPTQLPPQAADLALPPNVHKWLVSLPELQALSNGTELERLAGLRSWFAANFRYTLFLGDRQQGGRDLERFLLHDRAGHCEYFGTSTVLLLRALGIPARYVTGYALQEYSELEGSYIIRLRHAHAWAEGFINGRWVEVDTTPSTWAAMEQDSAAFWQPLADLMSFLWHRFSLFIGRLAKADPTSLIWLPGTLLVLALIALASRRLRRLKPSDQTLDCANQDGAQTSMDEMNSLRKLEQDWATLGLGRGASEPAQAWLARVTREGSSVIAVSQLLSARALVQALYLKRYGLPKSNS